MSDIDLKDTQYQAVAYAFGKFTLSAGGKSLEIPPPMITNFEIVKLFDTNIYPMYYMSVNVPLWMYTAIGENHDSVTATIQLQYKMSSDEDLLKKKSGFMTEISGNYKCVLADNTLKGDSVVQNKLAMGKESWDSSYNFNEYMMVEFSLYNTAAYNASFNRINAVCSSTNLTDALTYCLQTGGISSILLSKADNSSSFKEFKILPTSSVKNILRIIEDYQFHRDGTVVFFDLNQAYIINKVPTCNAFLTEEFKTVIFECRNSLSDGLSDFDGVWVDGENKLYKVAISKSGIKSQDIDDNPSVTLDQGNHFLILRTRNVVMDFIRPNKEAIVSFEGDLAVHNGKYRIYGYTINMVHEGDFYGPDTTIYLTN